MLAYFPVPYKDELLYSIIARYSRHTGQDNNQKAVLRDIFNTPNAVAISDLPSHLKAFEKNVKQVWPVSANKIIKHYTLAPVYLPFLSHIQAKKIVQSMGSKQGGNIHTRCGIAASSISQPVFFRYCPLCYQEQRNKLGEAYWQRSQQLSGVDVCYKHYCTLIVTNLFLHPKQKHLYQAAEITCKAAEPQTQELAENEIRLLRFYQELLDLQSITGHSAHQWTMFYQKLADKKGFKTGARVDHKSIYNVLQRQWCNSGYSKYLENSSEDNWLINIFRKHRKAFHPLHHLMVWSSLLPDASVKEIIRTINKLPHSEKDCSKITVIIDRNKKELIKQKRKQWQMIIKQHKKDGIKAIRAMKPAGSIYTWLYRHDRDWLMTHKPERQKNCGNHYLTDYAQWDAEILKKVKEIQSNYLKQNNRPRLSKTFIINELERSNSIKNHLQDLPETRYWLDKNAESIEDYQLYRIEEAAKELCQKNLPVKQWRILRLAGIRLEALTNKMQKKIKDLEK